MEIVTKSALETEKLGKKLANRILNQVQDDESAKVICLYGELGSGKTTFTRGFVKALNPKSRVMSPTFILIREYDGPQKIYHIDLYRLEKLEDTEGLGLKEILASPENIVIIEWPEIIKKILPKKRTEIYFKYLKDNGRSIHVIARSE